jgi:TolA-binding protein
MLCLASLFHPQAAGADDVSGGDPGAFLRLGQSARLKALGGAGSALLGEPWQLVLNPSAAMYAVGKGARLSHGLLFMDTDFQTIGYLHPIWGVGTLGAAVLNVRSTGFERRGPDDDDYTVPGPTFDVRHSALVAGLSRELSAWGVSAGFGLGIKVIQETVDDRTGTGVLFDVSAAYRPVLPYLHSYLTPLTVSVSGRNLVGSGVKLGATSVRYPAALDVGVGYHVRPIRVTALGDVEWLQDRGARWRAGAEAWPVDELALRVGRGGREWAAGIGVVYRSLCLDYAFAWHEYLEDTHRVSVGVWLDSSLNPFSLHERAGTDQRMGLDRDATHRRLRMVCAFPWAAEAPEAAYHAAEQLANSGSAGKARRLHRFLLGEHYPTEWAARGLLWLGDDAFARQHFQDAVQRYEEVLAHPYGPKLDTWQMRFRLASSHDKLEHWERAVAEYRSVLERASEGVERKTSLRRCADILFAQLARYSEALPLYEEVVRKYPHDDLRDPYFRLGMCGVYTGQPQIGLDAFSVFVERYPTDSRFAEASYRAGWCLYQLHRYQDALGMLAPVVEEYPADAYADDALALTGSVREALGEYQAALLDFARVTKDYPERNAAPEAMAGVARAYTFLGMADLAEQELQRLFRRYPDSEPARRLGGS